MPQVTFQFGAFEPPLATYLVPGDPDDPSAPDDLDGLDDPDSLGTPVIDVQRRAPAGAPRDFLRTRMYARPKSPHDAFAAWVVIHDTVGHYYAYDAADGDDKEDGQDITDDVVHRMYIGPKRFFVYELLNEPGHLYATTSASNLKEIFRRHRVTMKDEGAVFMRREVDVATLETTLMSHAGAETTGYTFSNIQSATTITRMVTDGEQIGDNDEVQGVKTRAEAVRALRFDLQHDDVVLRLSVDEYGTVKFSRYPGDEPALAVLHQLEDYIAEHSERFRLLLVFDI